MMGRMGIGSIVGIWSYVVDGTAIPHITWHSGGLHYLLVPPFVDSQPSGLAQFDSWHVLSSGGCTMMNANKATTGGRAIPDRVVLAVVFVLVGVTGT